MAQEKIGSIQWADETPGQPRPGAGQYGAAESLWTTFSVTFYCDVKPKLRKSATVEARNLDDLLKKVHS